MNYEEFDANDFVLDPYFNEWVKSPDRENNQFWESWFEKHSEKKDQAEIARRIISEINTPIRELSKSDQQQMLLKIKQRNGEMENLYTETPVISIGRKTLWLGLSKIAASFTILLTTSVILWLFFIFKNPKTISYSTPYGEVKTLILPDSSRVFLNANSTVTFASEWNTYEDRNVKLIGEAFFEVTKKPGQGNAKFRVHSGDVDVEVLGTQFNVYNRREKVQVVLKEGVVQLSAPKQDDKIRMQPGDLILYSSTDAGISRARIDPLRYSAWTRHELVFEDAPLSEVARSVEDILNLKIAFEDESYKSLPFTGTLSFNNPDELIAVLSKSFHIRVSRSENSILFHRK